MDPIITYIKDGTLPPDPLKARKIRVRLSRFITLNDELYKRGFPTLLEVPRLQGCYIRVE